MRRDKSFEGIIDRTGAQTMVHLTCITITSVDLALYRVSRAEDWVSEDCDTKIVMKIHTNIEGASVLTLTYRVVYIHVFLFHPGER